MLTLAGRYSVFKRFYVLHKMTFGASNTPYLTLNHIHEVRIHMRSTNGQKPLYLLQFQVYGRRHLLCSWGNSSLAFLVGLHTATYRTGVCITRHSFLLLKKYTPRNNFWRPRLCEFQIICLNEYKFVGSVIVINHHLIAMHWNMSALHDGLVLK